MKSFKFSSLLMGLFSLTGCIGNINPTGGNTTPDYPYFITTEALVVKNIPLPIGTKRVYEAHIFKEGQQNKMLLARKLKTIEFPKHEPLYWGRARNFN